MWRSLCLVFCVIITVNSQTTAVTRCSHFTGEPPLNVYVEGCENPPCSLEQLQNAVVHIIFKATRTLSNLQTLAAAFMIGLPIYHNLNEDAITCNSLVNTYCPIVENEVVQYRLQMYIEPYMLAGLQLPIEFTVREEDDTPVFCFRTTIRIVSPSSSNDSGRNGNNETLTIDKQTI